MNNQTYRITLNAAALLPLAQGNWSVSTSSTGIPPAITRTTATRRSRN